MKQEARTRRKINTLEYRITKLERERQRLVRKLSKLRVDENRKAYLRP